MNKSKEIYNYIKINIVKEVYKGGDKLSERELSEKFETSRTVVRDAITHLRKEEWLYTIPKKGTFIKAIDEKKIKENYEIRLILEPEILLASYPFLTKDDIKKIHHNCEMMSKYKGSRYAVHEAANHKIIRKSCPNSLLIDMVDGLMENYLVSFNKVAESENRRMACCEEWLNIAKALESGNIRVAQQFLIQHLLNSINFIL